MVAGSGEREKPGLGVGFGFAGRKSAVADMERDGGHRAAGHVGNISASASAAGYST